MAEDLSKKIRERKGFSFDKQGNMLFEECNLEKLASEYGTPCYVYSENIIRESCREYKNALKKESIEYEVIYAGKAFLTQTLCKIIDEEGLSLDASSGGEIYIDTTFWVPIVLIHTLEQKLTFYYPDDREQPGRHFIYATFICNKIVRNNKVYYPASNLKNIK